MKSASNEASSKVSDLDRAKAMSRALTRAAAPVQAVATMQRYTRLTQSSATSADEAAEALPALIPGTRWPGIVQWAQRVTEAHAAFAVDAKGLLVSAVGMEDEDATRMGGRLALAFDQSAQIDAVRSMVIDWAGETVTLIETRDADDVPVLLGLLGHRRAVPVTALVGAIHASLAPDSWKNSGSAM